MTSLSSVKKLALCAALMTVTSLSAVPASYAQTGRILRVSQPTDTETLDPALARTTEDANIVEQLFEGLTSFDPKDASPIPGAAKSWDISKDLKRYTFNLRKEAKWPDGSPVVADDFVYAWKRVLDPAVGSPWAGELYNLRNAKEFYEGKVKDFSQVGIRALSEHRLEVELIKPEPYFLNKLSGSNFAPVKRGIADGKDNNWTQPGQMVSNGPFVLSFREPKDKVVIKKNPAYWDAKKVYLDEVRFYPIEDENTGLKMYETDLLDVAGSGLPMSRLDSLRSRPDYNASRYLGVYFYRFNTKREPFTDKRVRMAFNLAIDKKVIAEKVLRGGQPPAYNLVPEGISWYRPAEGLKFDPVLANKILKEAGYCAKGESPGNCKPLPRIEILFNTTGNHKSIAEAMQAMLKENLGASDIALVNQDFRVQQAALRAGDYQLSRGGWIGDYVDPATFMALFMENGGNNLTGWVDPEYDKLVASAENTISPGKRQKLYNGAERILNEGLPILPLYFYVRIYLKKDYVKGYYSNILDKHPLKYVYLQK